MNVIMIRVNDLIIVMEFLCCILTAVNAFTDDTSPADNIGIGSPNSVRWSCLSC